MAFRALSARQLRWAALEGDGIEHLALTPLGGGVVAEGIAVGARGGTPYGCVYGIGLDDAWRTRHVDVRVAGGRQLVIDSDGDGNWRDKDGNPLPALDGAVDVDLAATPFTNTLPIRRLDLAEGESAELAMVYVPFPSLVPEIDRQRYTCLERGRRYLYEAADRSFAAELAVDEDGLVLDYPTLFRRLPG